MRVGVNARGTDICILRDAPARLSYATVHKVVKNTT